MKQLVRAALVLLTWQSTCVLAQSGTVPVVAVFDMTSRESGLKPSEIDGLTDYLSTRLGEKGLFQVVPREEIRKRLAAQKTDSYKKCYDRSCQIEVGRELAAQYTVSTSISRVGSSCLINGQLFDLRKAATMKTASAKKRCEPDELIVAIEEMSDKLQSAMSGTVVESDPDPLSELKDVDFSAYERPVEAPASETEPSPPPVEPPVEAASDTPWYKTWWFWTITGVVLVGAGVGIAAALTDGFSSTSSQTAGLTLLRF